MRTRVLRLVATVGVTGILAVQTAPAGAQGTDDDDGGAAGNSEVAFSRDASAPSGERDSTAVRRERFIDVDTREFQGRMYDRSAPARADAAEDGRVDRRLVRGQAIKVEFFDDEIVEFEPTEVVQTLGPEGQDTALEWHGHAVDESGGVLGTATFVVSRDVDGEPLAGYVSLEGRQIRLQREDGSTYRLVELDNNDLAKLPTDGQAIKAPPGHRAYSDTVDAAAVWGGTRSIRILVAYSNGNPGDIASRIDSAIADTNNALINSGSKARLVEAATVYTNYNQSASHGTDLNRLQGTSDPYMDEVHTKRNTYDADLVALAVPDHNSGTPGSCGTGYILPVEGSAAFGFSVTALADAVCQNHVFAHEIGHNLGSAHNPENAGSDGAFTYSYGHYVDGKASTLMTYPSVCSTSCPRQLQFSDPGASLIGYPGTPAGTSTRDNERSVDQVSWAVTAHRPLGSSNDYLWSGSSGGGFTAHAVNPDQVSPHDPIGGDFDGDGHHDVFWYYPGSTQEQVWWFTGTTSKTTVPSAEAISGTYTPVSGDFDGDGRDDIFWYRPGTGDDYIWWGASRSNFGDVESVKSVNVSSYRPFAGDFDGDGRDDVFWYAPGGTQDYIWWGNTRSGFGTTNSATSVNGDYAGTRTEDYDGDGEDDVFWYQPGSGDEYVWWGVASRSNFGNVASPKSVNGTFELTSGDYDGDGDSELFFYASGGGTDYVWNGQSSRSGFGPSSQSSYNVNGYYEPTSGDFGDNGRADVYWFAHG